MHRSKALAGFTLTELVIAVGLIGLLASMAIPGFITYQNRARRSEAFTNVGSLGRAEKGYFAEAGSYFEAPTHPITTAAALNADQHAWTAAAASDFAGLGWEPEGRVRYSYDVNTGATACAGGDCDGTCFTATGYGDLDVDDVAAAIVFVQPGVNAGGGSVTCPPHLFGLGVPVTADNEPVLHPGADDY
jgi:type IV pilus assembly protein PilE